jgi:centrin-1
VYVCKQAFDLIDGKGEGFLNPGKIRTALKEYGKYIASIELVYQICYDFDKDMNGKIDFKEFMDMMKMRPCESDSKEDIQKVFDDINEYRDNQGITP